MAVYRRVYDSHHLQADCQEPGSAAEPYALQSSMGYRQKSPCGSGRVRVVEFSSYPTMCADFVWWDPVRVGSVSVSVSV